MKTLNKKFLIILLLIFISIIFNISSIIYINNTSKTLNKKYKQFYKKENIINNTKKNIKDDIKEKYILKHIAYITTIQLEGFKLKVYKDNLKNTTCAGNSFIEYQKLFKTTKITEKNCKILINKQIDNIFEKINDDDSLNKLNDMNKIAIFSLIYNISFETFKNTNLYEYLCYYVDGNTKIIIIENIIKEWLDILSKNKKYQCGLLKRRTKEIELFFSQTKNNETYIDLILERIKLIINKESKIKNIINRETLKLIKDKKLDCKI